jgi:hypothetical protein
VLPALEHAAACLLRPAHRLADGSRGDIGQVEAEGLPAAWLPGPGAFLIGRGRVQRQRVARCLWLPAGKTVMQAIAQFTPEDRHTFERLLNQIADHLEHAVHRPSQADSH